MSRLSEQGHQLVLDIPAGAVLPQTSCRRQFQGFVQLAACQEPRVGNDDGALAGRKGHPEWFSTLEAVKKGMERHSRDGIGPNIDLWSGAVYRLLGIPEEMFSAVFAMGRLPRWIVHAMEQEASAVLLRPRLQYDGPVDLAYTPIEERG